MELGEWLGKRRKDRALEMFRAHVGLSKLAMAELTLICQGKSSKFDKIKGLEKDADELKRAAYEQLAKGELKPQDRADLVDLIKNLDKVTNFIYDSSSYMELMHLKGAIGEKAVDMCKEAEECVTLLEKCIEALAEGENEKALKLSDDVERSEERMDAYYAEAKRLLLKEKGSPQEIFLLWELLLSIERITDVCEQAADTIRVLLVKVW